MSTIYPNSNNISSYEPNVALRHLGDVVKDANRLADFLHGMLAALQLDNESKKTISASYTREKSNAEKVLTELAQVVEIFKKFEQTCKKPHELNSTRLSEITNQKKQLESFSPQTNKEFTIKDFFYYLDGINTVNTANGAELKQEIDDIIKKDYDILFAHAQRMESNLEKLLRDLEEPEPDVDAEGDKFYSLEEDPHYYSIIEHVVQLFSEQITEDLENPDFKELLKAKLIRQELMVGEGNIDREALSLKIDEKISTSPVTAVLRYGLFKIKAEETAGKLQDGRSFNAALNEIEETEGPRILEEISELIPDQDADLIEIGQLLCSDLKSKQRDVSYIVKTLRDAQASFPEKGVFGRCAEKIRDAFGGTPHILTSEEMASKHQINSEMHYGDGLRLARLFYLGDAGKNIKMGVKLLQKIRKELLKNPTKEKMQLLQDISVLYAQIKSGGNFLESLKIEINHSLYMTTLMGDDLPSEELDEEMKRLQGLVVQTSLFIKTYQGLSNTPTSVSFLSYVAGGPLISAITTGFSVYASFRSIDHLKALNTGISEHQKKEILSAFIDLDNLATSIEDLYADQFNTKLYALFFGENTIDSWIGAINHKFEKFSLELEYATTSEKVVRLAAAFFSPLIFAIDVFAFLTIFTALGVVTAGAALVASRQAMSSLISKMQNAYMLNEALADLVNSVYSDTHDRVEAELNKRKFLDYWQQYLSPSVDKIIFDKAEVEWKKILAGTSDTTISEQNNINWEDWNKLKEEEKVSLREGYFNKITKPQIAQLYKEVALNIYSSRKGIDFSDHRTKIEILKELEGLAESSITQQKQIKSFMMDWDIFKNDPEKAEEERKKLVFEKQVAESVEASRLSKENKEEALKLLRYMPKQVQN